MDNDPCDVRIRWMIRRDMPSVMEIENDSFVDPWEEEEFVEFMIKRNRFNCGKVLEVDGLIIGFVLYSLDESYVSLETLAVTPDYRGLGFGSLLLNYVATKLTTSRKETYAEICESDLPAQLFLRANGWRAYRVVRGGSSANGQDTYLFRTMIEEAAKV